MTERSMIDLMLDGIAALERNDWVEPSPVVAYAPNEETAACWRRDFGWDGIGGRPRVEVTRLLPETGKCSGGVVIDWSKMG